jgi:hypothetical protein
LKTEENIGKARKMVACYTPQKIFYEGIQKQH